MRCPRTFRFEGILAINYPAVQFYRRMGFRLVGLDETLFDPAGEGAGEVALFFAREVVR